MFGISLFVVTSEAVVCFMCCCFVCEILSVRLAACFARSMSKFKLCLQDIEYSYEHFKAFFQDFTALDTNTDFDSLSPPDIQGTMVDTPCGHLH